MSNSIQKYNELKKQLESVQGVQNITLSIIDHSNMGGIQNQFIVNGATPLFVKAMLFWAADNGLVIVNAVKEYMAMQVEGALKEAEAETKAFLNDVLPVETEYLASKAYVITTTVSEDTTLDLKSIKDVTIINNSILVNDFTTTTTIP